LEKLAVNLPIVSEEGGFPSFEDRKAWSCFWLVDPLDGTKEFVKKNDEFTVNIALICNGSPVLGVVYAPALDICYWAKRGEGAFKNGKEIDSSFKGRGKYYKIVVSRSHISSKTEKFIESIQTTKKKKIIPMGSSLKICLVVEGEADIYPRLGTTMEWDIGAAHAIASEAGVNLQCFDGVEFSDQQLYNKVSLVNEWFVLWADRPIFKG